MEAGIPVLGVCLGAQLIAGALGARVTRNPQKEIGWFPIESTSEEVGVFQFPKTCTVFHWHGETFDLPVGAVRLAKSQACENQAFQIIGRKVIGLQFHLETTPESLGKLIDNCRDELVAGPWIQKESELRGVTEKSYVKINILMDDVLSYLIGDTYLIRNRQLGIRYVSPIYDLVPLSQSFEDTLFHEEFFAGADAVKVSFQNSRVCP